MIIILGSGGFGVTYKAWDALLSAYVAIEEYFPKSVVNRMPGDSSVSVFTSMNADEFNRGIHRFLKEAKDLAWFNEIPGIVSVFDFLRRTTLHIWLWSILKDVRSGSILG